MKTELENKIFIVASAAACCLCDSYIFMEFVIPSAKGKIYENFPLEHLMSDRFQGSEATCSGFFCRQIKKRRYGRPTPKSENSQLRIIGISETRRRLHDTYYHIAFLAERQIGTPLA